MYQTFNFTSNICLVDFSDAEFDVDVTFENDYGERRLVSIEMCDAVQAMYLNEYLRNNLEKFADCFEDEMEDMEACE